MVADEPTGDASPDQERPGPDRSPDALSVGAAPMRHPATMPPGPGGPRRGPLRRAALGCCLLAPVVALVWVPWYNSRTPSLGGMPFFYWYQLLWVVITAVLMTAAHLLTRPAPPTANRAAAAEGTGAAGEEQR